MGCENGYNYDQDNRFHSTCLSFQANPKGFIP
jgi:hypothetical protein